MLVLTLVLIALLVVSALALLWMPARVESLESAGQRRVGLPIGNPFGVAFSRDGKYLFTCGARLAIMSVTPTGETKSIGVRKLPGIAYGCAVSNNGKWLAVGMDTRVLVFGIDLLVQRADIAKVAEIATAGKNLQVGFSLDDTRLISSQEYDSKLAVFDATGIPKNKLSLLGTIPGGKMPVGLAFMRTAGGTQMVAFTNQDDPTVRTGGKCTGSVRVADVLDRKVVSTILAGCSPVRIDVGGTRAFITARGSNKVNIMDLGKPTKAIESMNTGDAPVGVKLAMGGRYLVVACSNRFKKGSAGNIDIFDVNAKKRVKSLPAGKFPREVAVSPDGNVAAITNYSSNSLEVLYLPKLVS